MSSRIAMSVALLLAAALSPGRAWSAPTVTAKNAFVGTWRGTSTCMNRALAPACKDEVVVYRVTSAAPDTAHVAAYRIVGGEEQAMGDMRFDRGKSAVVWTSEFRTPRFHGRWSFEIADTILTGTLIDVPSRAVLRKVRAVRARVPR
jgi:hypothetical protein